ncbi:sigma-70 family RNA polymerase sigma factor [Sporosarcina jeotgali]|uniref:Sigma-70 family RNA polymerase sigma factor n=1 Tax=Sporosarcina jeotgali TaxID=3020056 RepID=A0ABZ0KUJ0_9BACL|nr:sigma-70 family RNA polymerase sigma factor [Sporosarcina sp. B2O-1]WOV83615.1 sigma-70 family RNA polymerase sigma factor [Sporosarcina sp. B2O-1]
MDEMEVSRKAIKGDETAFLALMRQHKEDLLRTALAFLKNEHDALEALQEVTVRAYHKIHTVKEPAYAKTWLIRIMMNYCQDQLKRQKRFHPRETAIDQQGIEDASQLELKEALAALPEKEQQLIYLKYFQDVKIKDIAILENIPEGTVKSRLHKTLRSLRAYFEDEGGKEHV